MVMGNFDPNMLKQLQQMASQYSGFTGQLYPKRKNIYHTPPVYEDKIEVGKDERRHTFSHIKLWVHEATQQYDSYSYFLGLYNRNSAFFKLGSIDELTQVIEWLTLQRDKLRDIEPELARNQEAVREANRAYAQKMSEIEKTREAIETMNNGG